MKNPAPRLFFCETLLEEYEHMQQPWLDPAEIDAIKADIYDYREDPKGRYELDFGGEMMNRIYQLFNKAQTDEAKKTYTAPKADPEQPDDETKKIASEIIGGTGGNGLQQGNGIRKIFEKPI